MSQQINNLRLNLDSIICISKIRSKKNQGSNNSQELFEEAFEYAKTLGDHKYAMNCLCNLGIMEGGRDFEEFSGNFTIPGMGMFPSNNDSNYQSQTLKGMMSQVGNEDVVKRSGNGNSQISSAKNKK